MLDHCKSARPALKRSISVVSAAPLLFGQFKIDEWSSNISRLVRVNSVSTRGEAGGVQLQSAGDNRDGHTQAHAHIETHGVTTWGEMKHEKVKTSSHCAFNRTGDLF